MDRPGAPGGNVTLREMLGALRPQRILIVSIVAIAVVATLVYSLTRDPSYSARTSLQFQDESEDLSLIGTAAAPAPQPEKAAAANAERIEQPDIESRVRRRLANRYSVSELEKAVQTHVEPGSNLVTVEAKSMQAKAAARIANAYGSETVAAITGEERRRFLKAADGLREQADRLSRKDAATGDAFADRISRLVSLSEFARPVRIVSAARTPEGPTSPRPLRDSALAGLLGLILGVLAAFLRSSLDQRLRTGDQISDELDLPMMGQIRAEVMGFPRKDEGFTDEDLEAIRIVRANIDLLGVTDPIRLLVVTSPLPAEGKSTVAASLAYTSALAGKRTLLLEADLRRPCLADRFGLPTSPGFADYLNTSEAAVVQAIAVNPRGPVGQTRDGHTAGGGATPHVPLACIVAGTPMPRSPEMLASSRCATLLQQFREEFELVVIDCPPLLPVVDTMELLRQADGALLCIRASQTTRNQARAAKEVLQRLPPRPTGVVVTGVEHGTEDDYGYYSYAYQSA